MKGKITAVLFILVFLLVVAVVFTFLTSLDRRNEAAQQQQQTGNDVTVTENTPEPVVETPAPASAVPYQAPAVTPAPVATPAPAPAATPEVAVIETPTPSTVPVAVPAANFGTILGSGSFSSQTGAHIDIRADWEARVLSTEEISVLVTVTLNSYSIYVNSLPNALNIGLNGQYVSLESPDIHYDSNTAMLSTQLGSQSFTVQLPEGSSRDLDLQVEWHWGGKYGGVDIPVIECGGSFTVTR